MVQLTHVDSTPLAVVRRRVRRAELSTVVPPCWGMVGDFLRAHVVTAGRHGALYLNDQIDLAVGVEIGEAFDAQSGVTLSSTPAGVAVSATHFGPYQGLGAAHEAIHAWCAANDSELAGPSWEIYGHWQPEWNADASRIRTDVFYKVREKA